MTSSPDGMRRARWAGTEHTRTSNVDAPARCRGAEGAGSDDWAPEEGGKNGATRTAKKGDTLGTEWSSNHGESVGSHCALSRVPPERRAEVQGFLARARGLTWYLWLWIRGRDSTTIFQANISWYNLYLHSSMGGFK